MKFWVDAQLPPAVAAWLAEHHGVDANFLRTLDLYRAGDSEIFEAARRAGAIVISKDSDFVDLVSRYGPPPQLLWVTCGNTTNAHLRGVFDKTFAAACTALAGGQAFVEIA